MYIDAIVVIALIIVTAFLIANTIKITIMSRKREIEIICINRNPNTLESNPILIYFFLS